MSDISFGLPTGTYIPEARHPALVTVPTLPNLTLTEDERLQVALLEEQVARERAWMLRSLAYYLGEQVIQNLRIAVPKELEFLRTIVGWPALAVDPYVERHAVDCFRLSTSTDADADLMDVWHLNGLDAELPLAVTDALSVGRGYWIVGSPDETGDVPQVTVESPLNIAVRWDLRGSEPTIGWQSYWSGDRERAAFYKQGETVQLAKDDKHEWQVVDRDPHGFAPPIVRMPHQPRTSQREGRSAITAAIRSITDSACRTLMGLEVAREIYSVPKELWLGATEADFKKSDGSTQSLFDAYMTRIKMIERDDEGLVPEIKQLQSYDPGVFTKLIDMYASQMASLVCAPPQDLGLYTQGNPVSADAVDAMENRRNRRARLQQRGFGVDLIKVMQLAMRFQNGGDLPSEFERMFVDWTDVEQPSWAQRADYVSKLVSAGSIPATSDVTLSRGGFSAIERQRLAQDRDEDQGQSFLQEVAHSLTAKAARTDKSLTADVVAPATEPSSTPTPAEVFGGRRPAATG